MHKKYENGIITQRTPYRETNIPLSGDNNMRYYDYVNVLQGTASVPQFSHGNILPLCSEPFGMSSYSLETRPGASLFFHPSDVTLHGIRLTHMPSPWINDYGALTFSAASGDGNGASINGRHTSAYTLRRSKLAPAEIDVELMLHRVRMRLTPTCRCSLLSLDWDEDNVTHRFVIMNKRADTMLRIDAAERKIIGYTRQHTGGLSHPETFALYFVMKFDRDFDMTKTVVGIPNGEKFDNGAENRGEGICANIAFASDGRKSAECRIATSFISAEQAEYNMSKELGKRGFDEIREETVNMWESRLSAIEITADEKVMRTFYSCLYRMFLFPRMFCEFTPDGRIVHYSPACGDVREGLFYTDNGFWDTYKTVYPLYSLINTDSYREMCEGFLNFYDEAGWLPRWMSPGAVNCMPGTAVDAVFGDAAVKGIVTDGKMLRRMLESTEKHINVPSDKGEYGRDGVESFNTFGYVSSEYIESVNKTQDYAYGNFCVAQIARALGENAEADRLMASSLNYRNLFDPESGFLRARDREGNMRSDWNCYQWGRDYTEGSAWQNSFAVFHDFLGLAQLYGGRDGLEKKMDELFECKPYYDTYGYGGEIHEMTEMAAVDFGQCALSNQPSFHIPYIYSCVGRPEKTAYQVRRACDVLFNDSVNGYPGDEDNGSMAGWYVFSALGFYPVCPGIDEYVIGSPSVKSAVIHMDSGKDLTIIAKGNSSENVYVDRLTLNGSELHKTYIRQCDLTSGGTLVFDMTGNIPHDSYTDDELPYSLSRM